MSKCWIWINVVLIFLFCAGCSRAAPVQKGLPVVSVTASQAVVKDMPLEISAIGNVVAYNSVTIQPEVTGTIMRLHFQEGQNVRKGDLLITIDPSHYESLVRQEEAQLVKENAQESYCVAEEQRYKKLLKDGAVSQSDYSKYFNELLKQQAIVQNIQAQLEGSLLDRDHCYIRAPIDGKVGASLVDQGNLVKINETKLLVINQMNPTYVKFSVPAKYLASIAQQNGLKVTVTPTDAGESVEGKLSLIDNAVDTATGAIMLKAIFDNKKQSLWPGQFVNVTLTLGTETGVVVVPSQAVQSSQKGNYIFVIKEDSTVELRAVTVVRTLNDESIISQGVAVNETVVTDGQMNLRDGFKVEYKTR